MRRISRVPGKTIAMSRRAVLARTVGLAAGSLLVPQVVPGRALGFGAVPPSDRVNVGLIGCGGRGTYESRCLAGSDKCQFVAVCDPWDSKTQRAQQLFQQIYAERFGQGAFRGCDRYRDFRELLARPDVDAVYIATADHWHVPITTAAARAGKDMHTEKPLGVRRSWPRAGRCAAMAGFSSTGPSGDPRPRPGTPWNSC